MTVNFDDLIPAKPSANAGISFDDLIPAAPPQASALATPAAAEKSGPDGGVASGTVLDGGAAFGIYPKPMSARPVTPAPVAPAAPVASATFNAGTPGFSVMGKLEPTLPVPTGVRPEYVQQVAQELIAMTPEQRMVVMQEGGLRGNIASRLLDQAAQMNTEAAAANTPDRTRRRDFAAQNPKTGALASGAAQTLKSTINIPTVAADLFNQTFINPVGRATGLGEIPRVGNMPGTDTLETMAKDYMPDVGKQSLASAIKKDQFQDWFLTNLSAQVPQIGQSIGMAMAPAVRPFMLPVVGGQEAASAYTEGDDSRVAATKGTVAALAEMLPLKAFDSVRDRILALPVGAQRGLMEEAARRVMASGSALTVQSLVGGIEEGLTEFGKNVVDNSVGKNVPLGKNVAEATVLGAGAGGAMAAPNMLTALTRGDTESPAAQIARAMQDGVDNTSINQDATRQAAVNALNPDNAQLREITFDDLVPKAPATTSQVANVGEPTTAESKPNFTAMAEPDSPEAVASSEAKDADRMLLAKLVQRGIEDGKTQDEIVAQAAQLFNQSISPSDVDFVRQAVQGNTKPPAPATDTQRVSTVTGRQIETRARVVDASELQAASGELQPRDRSRAASDEQINTIASQLDPQRLGMSAEADRGAPIIGPDMIVESGNGRVMSIRRAFELYPERAQAYRDYLQSLGYDTTGIQTPVLVRERVTELSPQDRVAFVQESNQSATMDLTPVERAQIDVSALKDNVVDVWMGGDVTDAANRDFVRAFVGQLPQSQRNGMMDDGGALSPDGATRIRRALLAAAYGDRELLTKLIESTDDNIKSIGNALFDSSGQWLQMRRLVREGIIDAGYDVTTELVQAARTIDQLRQNKSRVQEWLAQTDMMTERNPVVDAFVTAFYNADLTRAVGRDQINYVLRSYVNMAKSQDTAGLFGDAPPAPDEMVRGAVEQRNERNREPDNGRLFDAADTRKDTKPQSNDGAGSSVQPSGRQVQRAPVQASGTRANRGGQQDALLDAKGGRPAPAADGQGSANQTKQGDVNERAGRPDGNDQGAGTQSRQRRREDDGQDNNQRVKGSSSQSVFNKVSFTDRQSIYRDAFVELGYDPAEAELLPPIRQFAILSQGLKQTYGLAFVEKSAPANIRDSIDQLLDAYRGLQLMTHVLDLPTSAIGLRGTLGLAMTSQGKFLGAYFPGGSDGKHLEGIKSNTPTIGLPGRSNSFAHEWGHALDYFVLTQYDGVVDNLSGYVRAGETLSDQFPETVRDSFRLLMNTLFFDQAEQSAKIMDLERKIESAQQKGDDTTKLQASLDQIRAAAGKSRNDRSQFYKSAGDFAKSTGSDPDYWRKPTEMLARSFEAYVAHKVEAAGGSSEFIGKSDAAYLNDADERLAKTFPKDADRFNIFRAYDMLFDALRTEALLNPNNEKTADLPNNVRLSDPSVYFDDQRQSAQSTGLQAVWSEEKRAWQVRAREIEKQEQRPNDTRPLAKRMGDAVRALAMTNRGVLLSMERHYAKTGNAAGAVAIRKLTERLATDPGSGRKTAEGGIYAEAVERETRRFLTRLTNIAGNNNADLMTDEQLKELTSLLTQDDGDSMQTASDEAIKLAAPLRELLTDLYYYNRNAGLDIGFVKDQGYLPRLIDEPVVTANAPEFIKDATEVYKIVFERDTERPMDSDDVSLAITALDKRAREAMLSKDDPALAQYNEAKKKLRELLRKLDDASKAEEDAEDKMAAAQDELDSFMDENGDVFEEAYDYIRDAWSASAAAEYQTRISYGSPTDFSSHSPAGSYLKERTLPPEADKILAKYYIQDPIERITSYAQMSVRKSEYNIRFGKDTRNSKEKNTKLYVMLDAMVNAGVRKEDRDMAEKIVGQVTGTDRSSMPSQAQRTLGNIHALGQLTLLGRVVLTSLAEPITVATQTGKASDALKAIGLTLQEIANTGSVRERRAMARVLGIVAGDYADEMISNRLGGSFAESSNMSRVSANYFRRVGLTGLTNAQRRAAMQLSGHYVLELAHTLDDAEASAKDKGFARDELVDAGIQPSQIQDFVNWSREFTSRMPRHDELIDVDGSLTDMGKIYAVMVGRLVNQSIQSPTAIDRPWAANTPVGRLTYGLLSFSMAFFRNIMVKSAKKIEREYKSRGAAQAANVAAFQVLAPIASLYLGHLIVTVAREALLNPEKWDEEEKKEGGVPIKWLAQLAFSRAGFTGLADPLYNALMGVKYQRDLSNILTGSTASYFLQAMERILKYFVVNSENTNSAERNAARGLYELGIQPTLAYAAGYLPGGPIVGYGMGASYMYMSSPAFKSQWQDWLAGEKQDKQKKSGEQNKDGSVF